MRRASNGLACLLGVDKPIAMTSHDVVSRLRRCLGEGRVGHAGTLDPLASGVMVVGVGPATRLMQFATSQTKTYLVRAAFGRATATDDAEGRTVRTAPVPADALDLDRAREAMSLLTSMTIQVPPAYSAVHVDGRRAYDIARSGGDAVLAPRPIEVLSADVAAVCEIDGEPCWDVVVKVSKGTYVRSLVRDLGEALGSAAYVAALRRLSSGNVSLDDCLALQDYADGWDGTSGMLDPARVLGLPVLAVGPDEVAAVRDGKRLSAARFEQMTGMRIDDAERACLVYDTKLYALVLRQGPALVPGPVFPEGVAVPPPRLSSGR